MPAYARYVSPSLPAEADPEVTRDSLYSHSLSTCCDAFICSSALVPQSALTSTAKTVALLPHLLLTMALGSLGPSVWEGLRLNEVAATLLSLHHRVGCANRLKPLLRLMS